MQTLQEIFDRMRDAKHELRDLRTLYRDTLAQSTAYERIVEEYNALRERKKKIEQSAQDELRSEFATMEQLKQSIAVDKELLSGVAIDQYAKGETVTVTDKNDQVYEPVFSVAFKKV